MNNLKKQLQDIAKNEYVIPNEIDVENLVESMLENIGCLDSELRDDLIYMTLSKWIIDEQLDKNFVAKIIKILMDDNHLFYKIVEGDETSVFTRSFSVLIIASIIMLHRKIGLLNEMEIKTVYRKVMKYFLLEEDLRGYVDEYGWAHSAAHTADALDELAMCKELGKSDLIQILDEIKYKVSLGNYVYVHKEDERMVTAVMSIISREIILETELVEWIKSFSTVKKLDDYMKNYTKDLNINNFMRSMYFRLLNDKEAGRLCDAVLQVLNTNSF